jgi:hypothetical protein
VFSILSTATEAASTPGEGRLGWLLVRKVGVVTLMRVESSRRDRKLDRCSDSPHVGCPVIRVGRGLSAEEVR